MDAFFLVLLLLFIYFTPALVAYSRGHRNFIPILIINIFLGWTFLGWVVAFAMSFTRDVSPGS